MILPIDEHIKLEVIAPHHAADLLDVVNDNRQYLSRFLPWVGAMQKVSDFERYIQQCEKLVSEKAEMSFVILYHDVLVGRIGIHHINRHNQNGAIGYWLAETAGGKGIMLRCCRTVIDYGFDVLQLKRIEIRAATENVRSKAIPQKLGFTFEGVMRKAELVGDRLYDIAVYSMLWEEWTEYSNKSENC